MRRLVLALTASLALGACQTTGTGPVTSLPGGAQACAVIQSDKFDVALKAYGAAVDAVNLMIDLKVLVPGTPRALAIATANDRVLAAFATAEHARKACKSTDYQAALNEVSAAIAEVRAALKK